MESKRHVFFTTENKGHVDNTIYMFLYIYIYIYIWIGGKIIEL